MRAENIRIAAKKLQELEDLERKIKHVEKVLIDHKNTNQPWQLEFSYGVAIPLTPSVFIGDLKSQADKLRFTIKALGVED